MKPNQILGIASLLALGSLPFLAACSDDSSESSPTRPIFSETSSSSAKKTTVKTTFELGSCTYENKGDRVYVSDESDYYTCTYSNASYDYTWVGEKAKSSSSISSSSTVSSSSMTVSSSSDDVCDIFYCWDETESSSSVKSSSSSSNTRTFANVSEVWNGKMVKPSTDYINGKTYMLIYTAEELAYFADQVTNKGEEKLNAKLMKHIRLNPDNMVDEKGNLLKAQSSLNEWTPIGGGTNNIKYMGTFDGNGYTVSGIYVNKPAFERAGFIGTLGGTSTSDSGHVMFLGIENSYIVGGEQVGGIVGRMNFSEVQQVFNRKSYVKGTSMSAALSATKITDGFTIPTIQVWSFLRKTAPRVSPATMPTRPHQLSSLTMWDSSLHRTRVLRQAFLQRQTVLRTVSTSTKMTAKSLPTALLKKRNIS